MQIDRIALARAATELGTALAHAVEFSEMKHRPRIGELANEVFDFAFETLKSHAASDPVLERTRQT